MKILSSTLILIKTGKIFLLDVITNFLDKI